MAVAGKVAITPKGEWNANTAYTKLDLVFYDNASYVAIQPSTGVEPTNTSYWMLMVQSAGGADLEAIINGTTQVGNAKTLDGHGAEYFFPKSGGTIDGNIVQDNGKRSIVQNINSDGLYQLYDNTNKKNIIYSEADGTTTFGGTANGNLPLTGGTINGNIEVKSAIANAIKIAVENTKRRITLEVDSGGNGYLWDGTNGKAIASFSADGTNNTWNGTASGNLPLSGGRISANSTVPLELQATNSADTLVIPLYNQNGEAIGSLGFRQGKPIIRIGGGTWNEALHTGNKPTGTYTGNGSDTERTINTGGTGSMVAIYSESGGIMSLVTAGGAITSSAASLLAISKDEAKFVNGVLTLKTTVGRLNGDGITYTYQVL